MIQHSAPHRLFQVGIFRPAVTRVRARQPARGEPAAGRASRVGVARASLAAVLARKQLVGQLAGASGCLARRSSRLHVFRIAVVFVVVNLQPNQVGVVVGNRFRFGNGQIDCRAIDPIGRLIEGQPLSLGIFDGGEAGQSHGVLLL
ncbi:MAG: hypothetical protein WD872_01180 [Pirellulaceae bacterium]